MPKGKVIHHQRVIGRIFRAAQGAEYPVEQIEFCPDGTIIVRPRAVTSSTTTVNQTNPWDEVLPDAAHQERAP